MEPNLYEGDYIIVSKWSYGYSKHSIPFSPPLFQGRILGTDAAARRHRRLQAAARQQDRLHQAPDRPAGRPHPDEATACSTSTASRCRDVAGHRSADVTNGVRHARSSRAAARPCPGGKTITIQDFGPDSDLDNTDVFTVPAGPLLHDGRQPRQLDRQPRRARVAAAWACVPAENLVGKAADHPVLVDARGLAVQALDLGSRTLAPQPVLQRPAMMRAMTGRGGRGRSNAASATTSGTATLLERALTHASVGDGARAAVRRQRAAGVPGRPGAGPAGRRAADERSTPTRDEGRDVARAGHALVELARLRPRRRAARPAAGAMRLSRRARTKVGARDKRRRPGRRLRGADRGRSTSTAAWRRRAASSTGSGPTNSTAPREAPRQGSQDPLQEWAQGPGLAAAGLSSGRARGPGPRPDIHRRGRASRAIAPGPGQGRSRQDAEKAAADRAAAT